MPILLLLVAQIAADLTGLWHARFTAPDGAKRELHLALKVDGKNVSGVVETPTRRAPLVEGKLAGRGFTAIAQSDWDGKLARRPVEAQLKDLELHLRIQAWPDGPMADYVMRRIGREPVIDQPPPMPLPGLRDVPYNGLAATPPMGWSSWNKFGCRVDETMIREMADAMASSGMKDAGYTYINIDDCWQGERDSNGNIQSDPKRFPDMKALVDYVHAKGLKIGIYSSPGPRTCAGYEGSYGHEEQDARTYANWGFDYLKYDWCSAGKLYKPDEQRAVFQKMGLALQATGRPMVYSISQYGVADVWTWAAKTGANLWRTTGDIGDNWKAVEEIGFDQQLKLAPFAGPGRWNDPDMLEVGNGGMTTEEYRTHMSLWALLAAPLIAGNDLRAMSSDTAAILMNREVIAIDQDPLGKQGTRAWKEGTVEVWTKPLKDGSTAIGIFNRGAVPRKLSVGWRDIGLSKAPTMIYDVWRRTHPKPLPFGHPVELPAHGVVLLRVK
jgi:alpha-galactosidase